jgi:conjugal transfer pilus assembly protein TraB
MQSLNDLKAKWSDLDPKKRRNLMIVAIIIVLFVVALAVNNNKQKSKVVENAQKQNERVQKTRIVSPVVNDVGIDDLSGQTKSQIELQDRKLSEILNSSKELRQDTAVKTESLKQSHSELAQGLAQLQDEVRVMRLGQEGSAVNEVGGVKLPALAGIDSDAPAESQAQNLAAQPNGIDPNYNNQAIEAAGLTPSQPIGVAPNEMIHPTPQPESGLKITRKEGTSGSNSSSMQQNRPTMEKNRSNANQQKASSVQQRILASHMLPTGSMIDGLLISGMDAATGRGSSSPVPALVRVKKNAILPNRYAQDVRECFILLSGVGDLARERALLRTEKISCIFNDGRVLDTALSGYVVGEDGKNGLRGRVVSKQGSFIAKSVFASFLEGFGSSLKPSAVNSLDISGSGSIKYQQAQLKDAMESGAYDGISEGFSKVGDYYLNLAEQMFPIIEIDAGRKVTIILTSRLDLKLSTVDAVKSAVTR